MSSIKTNYPGKATTQAGGAGWKTDGNKIVDHLGNDVQWVLELVGSIVNNTTEAEYKQYIDDRKRKGVNALGFGCMQRLYGSNTPRYRTTGGEDPFNSTIPSTSSFDFSDPNEDYWVWVDGIIDYAAHSGMTVFLVVSFLGWQHGSEGWADMIADNGTSRMADYGTFLADRYKDRPNIVWVMGGDWDGVYLSSDIDAEINATANAIKAADPNHLMTAHHHGEINESSRIQYNEDWLDFNGIYEKNTYIVTASESEYGQTGSAGQDLPIAFLEGGVTNLSGSGITDIVSMRQSYVALLSGNVGVTFLTTPQWHFSSSNGPSPTSGSSDWENVLDTNGAQYLTYLRRLQLARDLPSIEPDHSDTFVTAGKGTKSSGYTYSPARANSSQLVAFCNSGASLTVDKSQFSGNIKVRWYSPTDGSSQTEHESISASGSEVFAPPTVADWVLLIDLVSLDLGVP